jgi:hypothetical protein
MDNGNKERNNTYFIDLDGKSKTQKTAIQTNSLKKLLRSGFRRMAGKWPEQTAYLCL